MSKVIEFVKKEIVFTVACVLAFISIFFVHPSSNYISYINFQTLALLLALMLVVQGLNSCGLFDKLVELSLSAIKNTRQLTIMMILLCFVSSMFITNDVALITFVPFTIILLNKLNDSKFNIQLIILETMAANLGSMFTPIGNPQNLYLYSVSGFSLFHFLRITLPYTVISLIVLLVSAALIPNKTISENSEQSTNNNSTTKKMSPLLLTIYFALFATCILTVLDILDYRIMLAIVLFIILLVNRKLIPKADYILLLTFIAFFIFIGNMKNMPAISSLLSKMVTKRECIMGVVTSQFVSNVPAAVLLSGFSQNISDLIIGTNLGGLGTLIASMASLISYKYYVKTKDNNAGKYIIYFGILSIIYLAILLSYYFIF